MVGEAWCKLAFGNGIRSMWCRRVNGMGLVAIKQKHLPHCKTEVVDCLNIFFAGTVSDEARD